MPALTKTIKPLLTVVMTLAFVLSTGSAHASEAKHAKLKSEISAVFAEYKAAIASLDGEKAYSILSKETHEHWNQMHRITIEYDREALIASDYVIKMSVLVARTMLDRELLVEGSARDMFVAFVEKKQLGYKSMPNLDVGNIRPDSDRVTAEVVIKGQPSGEYLLHFVREESGWKFDSVAMFKFSGELMANMLAERNWNQEEFLEQLIKQETGKKLQSSHWRPLR